jgi:hypothetical protein
MIRTAGSWERIEFIVVFDAGTLTTGRCDFKASPWRAGARQECNLQPIAQIVRQR